MHCSLNAGQEYAEASQWYHAAHDIAKAAVASEQAFDLVSGLPTLPNSTAEAKLQDAGELLDRATALLKELSE
jgi:hypothetical protein